MIALARGYVRQDRRVPEAAQPRQLVCFRVLDGEYGVEISDIREFALMADTAQRALASPDAKGAIRLRGEAVLAIDLRAKSGPIRDEVNAESRVAMLQVSSDMIGIIVDALNEVLRATRDRITPSPPTVAGLGGEYLTELAAMESQLLILSPIDESSRRGHESTEMRILE